MKVYELSQIGQFHTNHNEDSKLITDIGEHRKLLAVMDGCSTGTDSHFASNLIGKCLRQAAKNIVYKSFMSKTTLPINDLSKVLMHDLFRELIHFNSRLDLRYDELLSTIMFAVIDEQKMAAELRIVGDGIICVDRQITEFEQDNKPDYIGYHLKEDFEDWYQNKVEKVSVTSFQDLSISTDGIHTFKPFDNKDYPAVQEGEILDLFLKSKLSPDDENALRKKLLMVEKDYGLKPSDDITIVRVVAL